VVAGDTEEVEDNSEEDETELTGACPGGSALPGTVEEVNRPVQSFEGD